MLLDNTKLYDDVWGKVYTLLNFKPNGYSKAHSFDGDVPFVIHEKYAVYNVEKTDYNCIDKMEDTIRNIFIEVTEENERIYALDWQHSAFLYNPRNKEEQKSIWVESSDYPGTGYTAYFPDFFPDGDYYFFIDEHFRFGYLGHPWRQEIWIFGEKLLNKFEQIYDELGWIKLI